MEDERWYKLICCWCKEAPAFEAIFPLFEDVQGGGEDDEEATFREVTAALTPYREAN
jgi:hypothetical protein